MKDKFSSRDFNYLLTSKEKYKVHESNIVYLQQLVNQKELTREC